MSLENDEINSKIRGSELSSYDSKILTEIMKNLSALLPTLPVENRKAILQQVIVNIVVYKKNAKMKIGERVYSLPLNKKPSANSFYYPD